MWRACVRVHVRVCVCACVCVSVSACVCACVCVCGVWSAYVVLLWQATDKPMAAAAVGRLACMGRGQDERGRHQREDAPLGRRGQPAVAVVVVLVAQVGADHAIRL